MSTVKTNAAKASVNFLSCSEIIRLQEATREARSGPQPWILRKLTVGIVVLIIGWATYVYIGRVCVRMINPEDDVVGSRGLGSEQYQIQTNAMELIIYYLVTLIVIFSLLWFMFAWSYAKVRVAIFSLHLYLRYLQRLL